MHDKYSSRSQTYDVVLAEYPSRNWEGSQALQLLHQTVQDIPLSLCDHHPGGKSLAELAGHGAFDYVEQEQMAHLPMAVCRAVNEKNLRAELEQAEKALRHSQSRYRALMEHPAVGALSGVMCKVSFSKVNQDLWTMLGYPTKEELLAADGASGIVLDLKQGKPLPGSSPESVRIESVEIEWKRKNETILKARLSGRGVFSDLGDFAGYEIIVVDITEQRGLEDHLRRQVLSDSLTGLANHGRLFEVLHTEISRSKRTEREFSLLLLDSRRIEIDQRLIGRIPIGGTGALRSADILAVL